MNQEFPSKYQQDFEAEIYQIWKDQNLFAPNLNAPNSENFMISMPPPNVTGVLHLGHALMLTIEDIMVRVARMQGKKTLWIPGTDHAGISTQVVVEKKIKKETGKSRHAYSRAQFLEKIWEWVKYSRTTIVSQIEKMGSSCDWSQEQFTLGEKLSRAVRKSFVNLFSQKKIFQSSYLVNWCPRCQTVLSDLEVIYQEQEGKLYYLKYYFPDQNNYILIGTSRPETIFADVAIAVNPEDSRYLGFIGQHVQIPIIKRLIPVIAEEKVDLAFGTGALKITPTHDPVDFEIGQKHQLPLDIFALDRNGKYTSQAGELAELDVYQNYDKLIELLKNQNYLEKIEKYTTNQPFCERCKTKIEPLVSKQWFVDVKKAANQSIQAVQDKITTIHPARFNKIYYNWLENIRPWCISRQLRWGHRIPVWYCPYQHTNVWDEDSIIMEHHKFKILTQIIFNLIADSRLENNFNINDLINVLFTTSLTPQEGKIWQLYLNIYKIKYIHEQQFLTEIINLEKILNSNSAQIYISLETILEKSSNIRNNNGIYQFIFKCKECGAENLIQEEDVLDTWFSSALWPFSILGWPDNTVSMQHFYPNTVLETGYDIIFFWVARMMMMGISNTDQAPFQHIYLHGIVRTDTGAKMSKSSGTVIDPLDLIAKYGADALRLGLVNGSTPGNDIKFSVLKVDYAWKFINKLWNACRYINIKHVNKSMNYSEIKANILININNINEFDGRILMKLEHLLLQSNKYLPKFMLGEFCSEVIEIVRHDFCDWYIEISKIENSPYTIQILQYFVITVLQLLHPYIPHVTEKIWQLFELPGFLMVTPWPITNNLNLSTTKIQSLIEIITQIRNLRQTSNIPLQDNINIFLYHNNLEELEFITKYTNVLQKLLKINQLDILKNDSSCPDGYQTTVVNLWKIGIQSNITIDKDAQNKKLTVKLAEMESYVQSLQQTLSNPDFIKNASSKIIFQKKQMEAELLEKIEAIKKQIH